MNKYYLGGYYLIQQKYFESLQSNTYTCSTCINDSLLGAWGYEWVQKTEVELNDLKKDLLIDDATLQAIYQWRHTAENTGNTGWPNVFANTAAAKEYKQRFFNHIPGLLLIGLYFDEQQTDIILKHTTPGPQMAPIGIYSNLLKKIPEAPAVEGVPIGYDLIRIEISGDFHTFHCYNAAQHVQEKFRLTLNRYGLLEDTSHFREVLTEWNKEEDDLWTFCKCLLIAL